MSIAAELLKARHIGVKDFRAHLAAALKKEDVLIVTQHGQPSKVVIDYDDMLELVDVVDEIQDPSAVSAVMEGRKAVRAGALGIPVTKLFQRVRARMAKRKK